MSFISSLEPSQTSGTNQTWTFCGWNSVYLWPNLASWLWAWEVRWGSLDIRSVLPNKALIGSNMNASETRRLTCCQNPLGPTHRSILCQAQCILNVALHPLGGNIWDFLPDTVEIGSCHSPSTSNKYINGFLWRLFDTPVEWGSWRNLDISVFEAFVFNQGQSKQDSVSRSRMALIPLCLFLNTGWQARPCAWMKEQ